jgi:aminoglycoside/choline kinase family phosphotransferase
VDTSSSAATVSWPDLAQADLEHAVLVVDDLGGVTVDQR